MEDTGEQKLKNRLVDILKASDDAPRSTDGSKKFFDKLLTGILGKIFGSTE